MKRKPCKTCKYFNQHYVKTDEGYEETRYGHCVNPRYRLKESIYPNCEMYEERDTEVLK